MEAEPIAENNDKFNLGIFLAARAELRDQVEAAFTNLKSKNKFDRKDIIKVLSEVHGLVQVLDNLSDIMINDFMMIDKRFQALEERLLAVGQSHTVLRQSLEDKNVVTKEDMQKAWDEKIKPQLEAKIKAAQETTDELENLVKPVENSTLLGPDGYPIQT